MVGILSLTVDGTAAAILTTVVHPDHRRQGVGRGLLEAARLSDAGIKELDAWTRDDPGTLAWYRAMGIAESDHYLHVYADRYAGEAEPDDAGLVARPGFKPMAGFLHGRNGR